MGVTGRRYIVTWRPQGRCAACSRFVGRFAAAFGNGLVWCDRCAYGGRAAP